MSEITFKKINLSEIIDFRKSKTNGSAFTRLLIKNNKGNIPVYGASNDENVVGYGYVKDNLIFKVKKNSKEKKVKYFENCLTWNIDGSVAIFFREGRFSLSEKVIPLIPYENLKNQLHLHYIKYAIMEFAASTNYNFSNKAGKSKLMQFKIKIPVKKDGIFDLETQKLISQKYELIETYKKRLFEKKHIIDNINVKIEENNDFKNVKVTDLFDIFTGSNKYTKKYCSNAQGYYPVYSSNNSAPFTYINSYDYEGKYLTWSVVGCAGYIAVIDGKFSITNNRGILIPKCNVDNLNIDYIKYVLEPIFRDNKKGRLAQEEKNEYTILNKKMLEKMTDEFPIPIKKDGTFDLEAQKEIAKKIKSINYTKKTISEEINRLLNMNVSFFNHY